MKVTWRSPCDGAMIGSLLTRGPYARAQGKTAPGDAVISQKMKKVRRRAAAGGRWGGREELPVVSCQLPVKSARHLATGHWPLATDHSQLSFDHRRPYVSPRAGQ